MKSLFWKQMIEMKQLLQMIVGVTFLTFIFLLYFRSNSENFISILIGFYGSIISIYVGSLQFEPEKTHSTLPFLLGLPLTRFQIWVTKLFSGLVVVFGTYLFFGALGILLNSGILRDLGPFFRKTNLFQGFEIPVRFFFIPIFLFSGSFFSSFLSGFSSFLAICPLFLGMWASSYFGGGLIVTNEYYLLVMLSISMLVSSLAAFSRGGMMDGWKNSVWGIGAFYILLIIASGIWLGLDFLADSFWLKEGFSLSWVNTNQRVVQDEKEFLLCVHPKPLWWDPAKIEYSKSTIRVNRNTLKVEPYSSRFFRIDFVSPDGRYFVGTKSGKFGMRFMKGGEMVLIDRKNTEEETSIDSPGWPYKFGFTKNGAFIFFRTKFGFRKSGTDELVSLTPGKKEEIIGEWPSGNWVEPRFLHSLEAVLLYSRSANDNPLLIMLKSGKKKKLPIIEGLRPICSFGDKFLLESGSSSAIPGYYSLDSSGNLASETWISTGTQILGADMNGKLIGIESDWDMENPAKTNSYRIERFDDSTKTISIIATFSGKGMILGPDFDSEKRTLLFGIASNSSVSFHLDFFRLSLNNGNLEKIQVPFHSAGLSLGVGPNQYVVQSGLDLWFLNLDTKECRKFYPN